MAKRPDDTLEITRIANEWAGGDESKAGELFAGLESQLRAAAERKLKRDDRMVGLIDAGDVVNEVFLKLNLDFRNHDRDFPDRARFWSMVTLIMERTLYDMARKGGADQPRRSQVLSLTNAGHVADEAVSADVLALRDALQRLEARSPDLVTALKLHYYAGLTLNECAREMGHAKATFGRRLALAKQWVRQQLIESAPQADRSART